MLRLSAQRHRLPRLVASMAVTYGLLLPLQSAWAQQAAPPGQGPSITRIGMHLTTSPDAAKVTGTIFALDQSGQAIANLSSGALQASVDGKPVQLSLLSGRPSIALAAGFLLDSAASPRVRDAVARGFADAVQPFDPTRDSAATVSTAQTGPWEQATFATAAQSASESLTNNLNQVIQTTPIDSAASLEQVFGVLRALSGQQRDARVLLLFINRPLASAASVNASLGTIRTFAADNGIQVSIVALPGTGGQGPSEALAEATPAGRVEYVLDATNRQDISRRVGLLLAPVFGAHRFEIPAPSEGSHVLSVGAPGVALQAAAPFQTTGHAVQIESLMTDAGPLQPGTQISQPTWVQAVPADNVPIDSVEFVIDGHVTQVTGQPWALLLDPEQLGDGRHELTARMTSQGRAGPFLMSSIAVPSDFWRTLRNLIRGSGLIALLVIAEIIIVVLLLRMAPVTSRAAARTTDFPPTLRLNSLTGTFVAPEVIDFPTRGKLRIGYHPPYMDNHVGRSEFSRLPYQDIRGDEETVKDVSRHAAVIWRDPKTNDCYIQLGWPGPGEAIAPKPQSQVFHLGRPQDAASAPFRLAHYDVVRLGTGVEFVFHQVGLGDRATPQMRKIGPFKFDEEAMPVRFAVLASAAPRHATVEEPTAEEG